MKDTEEISRDVLDVALRLHKQLGPGLLESVYEIVLAAELAEMGYTVARQVPVARQLLTCLRLTNQPVGLLLNFGGATLKEGVRRLVNDYHPSASPRLRANQITASVPGGPRE